MPRLTLLALVLLTACANSATLAPRQMVVVGQDDIAATAEAVGTQAAALPITESAANEQFNREQTATYQPASLTGTAVANQSTAIANDLLQARATGEALNRQNTYSVTLEAYQVLRSETQKRVAENNAAIANATNGANTRRDVLTWGAGICLFAFGVFAFWCVIQAGLYVHNTRKARETSDKWKRVFDAEKLMLAAGVAPTSAGPTSYSVVPLAEKHVADYSRRLSRDDQVRAALKNYVSAGVDLARQGVKFPYSRANACKHLLVTHPATGDWWQLGHDRIVKMLRAMKVLDNTGQGGETVLVVDVGEFARVIDLTPLPDLPFDPVPAVKITVAS